MRIRALSWNLYHGRDFPPNPALFTWRSRVLRVTERDATHVQVNRDLLPEFSRVLAAAEWDVALLQECPPRWAHALARAAGAEAHLVLTSRNTMGAIRGLLARQNPDLVASNEGGSNLTLARPGAGRIAERRELVLAEGPSPERRTMAYTRLESGLCVGNLHASTSDLRAAGELRLAAARSTEWADQAPLILGGDFNIRPRDGAVYVELQERFGFSAPTDPDAIDHLLARGLEVERDGAPWPPDARELEDAGLRLRLSDHAPLEAVFRR